MKEITYETLVAMSIVELRDLNTMVVEVIKLKKDLMGREKVRSLSVGDEFKINHQKHIGDIFITEKINKKRIVGKNKKTGLSYNIPFEMVEKLT